MPGIRDRPVLLTGATGFVGGALALVLEADGVPLRCASRRPDDARRAAPERTWVGLDLDEPDTIGPALEGCSAAIFLVHSMGDGPDYVDKERRSAEAFARAAEAAGIERVVYLGGVRPQGEPSRHLLSRLETGRILRNGAVPCVEIRAGMIIGAGSESWRIVRDLAMRLPLQLLPSWLQSRSQPIAIDDICVALAYALEMPLPAGSLWLDAPGPETLSAQDILRRVGSLAGIRPVQLPIPILSPGLSSWWLRLITRADFAIARELVHGLSHDLLAADDGVWRRLPDHERMTFDEAARRALAAEADTLRQRDRLFEGVVRRLMGGRIVGGRTES